MDRTYVVIPRNCTGCRTCELACAFAHAEAGKLGRSRIAITAQGGERYVQMTCFQCVEAACAAVCPSGALVRHETSGAIELDRGACIHCGLCAAACPFGHIQFPSDERRPVKCDLCGGDPACAKFCPHRALEMR